MKRYRQHLSFANVTSILALVVALATGGAYAAEQLGANDVRSKHIKPNAVKNSDIADNAVTSPKVENASLLAEDFAAGQLPAGPQGPQGPQGLQGLQGAAGTSGMEQVAGNSGAMDSTAMKTVNAQCPTGKVAIAGGARLQGVFTQVALDESHRNFGDASKWQVSAHEVGTTDDVWLLEAYAICVLAP